MNTNDEHDDDIEPEVIEGEEIEAEKYEVDQEEENPPGGEVVNPMGSVPEGRTRPDLDEEEPNGEGSDTI